MNFYDFHVHLEEGPFTIDWLRRFIEVGEKRGVVEIGFTEHGHRFKESVGLLASDGFRGSWTKGEATESIEDYIEIVQKAKDMGLPVKLGIELDYVPEFEEQIKEFAKSHPFDYVLGGIHWLGDFGFDHPDLIHEWDEKDVDEVYVEYLNTLLAAVKSGIYEAIAHPDVIKVFGHKARRDMSKYYDELAKAVKEMDICVEVSTAGLRKPVGELYPSPELMKYFKKYEVPIMISSDAHVPEDVGRDFDKALSFVKAFGYDKICYFDKRIRKSVKITG
jgi:histidinol-phosphatase (PHP family)